jgi:hypothetical protein
MLDDKKSDRLTTETLEPKILQASAGGKRIEQAISKMNGRECGGRDGVDALKIGSSPQGEKPKSPSARKWRRVFEPGQAAEDVKQCRRVRLVNVPSVQNSYPLGLPRAELTVEEGTWSIDEALVYLRIQVEATTSSTRITKGKNHGSSNEIKKILLFLTWKTQRE